MHLHVGWKVLFAPHTVPAVSHRKSPAFSRHNRGISGKSFALQRLSQHLLFIHITVAILNKPSSAFFFSTTEVTYPLLRSAWPTPKHAISNSEGRHECTENES